MPPSVLIVGGSRGLGASLGKQYAAKCWNVFATCREFEFDGVPRPGHHPDIHWVVGVDLLRSDVGDGIVRQLRQYGGRPWLDVVIISAGIFEQETWDGGPNWQRELDMYTTSSIAPLSIVHRLVKAGMLREGSKVVLVSSEAGSIALRTSAEMNYGHHGSKAALNMVGRLLSFDLRDKKIVVAIVHPGFMRTDMTRSVGLDQVYERFHAVDPDEAAESLKEWIARKLDMTTSGRFWAPRGPVDIGTAGAVMGIGLPTPLELPW